MILILQSSAVRRRSASLCTFALALAWGSFPPARNAVAAVTAIGNVTPAPPIGGGNIAATFLIGATGQGTVTITNQPSATALTVNGFSTVIGDAATASGLLSVTGIGSSISMSQDLVIGVNGAGSAMAQNFARIATTDDLFLASEAGSSGTLLTDGFGTVTDIGDDVTVGSAGVGLVQITGGARMLADATVIGRLLTADGTITVSGNSSLWRQENTITVADAGRGVLQILTSGRVENANATVGNAATAVGTVNVSGTGSVWEIAGFLNLGANGRATLNVVEGGRVTNTGLARLGNLGSAEARVLVSGVGSTWSSGTSLTVGDFGFGSLRITGGGRVNASNVVVGANAGARGDVLVDGVGSVWDIGGTLDVSDSGEAQLTVSNDGLVTTTGVARVAAAGRLTLAGGRLDVGAAGGLTNQGLVEGVGRISGAMINSASGEIRTRPGGALVLGNTLTNTGLVNVDGGELEVTGAATNTADVDVRNAVLRFDAGLANNAGGALAFGGGAIDVFGAMTNAAGAQIVAGGRSQVVFHDAVTNNGQLFVMPGSDVLMLENLSFGAASLLNLQLAGEEPQVDFGQVEVVGPAALSGTLAVQLADGFAPQLGDSFQVLTAAGGVMGSFAGESLPALSPGLTWDVDYAANSLTLSVVPGLTADFNGDGDVDAADLADWKAGFGTAPNAIKTQGDADEDGDVDGADFLAWQRELGSAPAATGGAAAVPEPAALGLMGIALAIFTANSRRR